MRISPRRLLSIAAILMLLTAILHTVGNVKPATDPALIGLQDSMRSFRLNMGFGMTPSMFDAFMALVLIMTITFIGFAILNLALASARDLPDHLLRRVIWINVIWVAAFTALCWFYRISPPLISGIVIEVPLIAALFVKNH